MVSGGRATEAGPLGMKRELRALEAEAAQREIELTASAHRNRARGNRAGENENELTGTISAGHMEAEKALVGATHQRDQARASELVRMGIELRDCQTRLSGCGAKCRWRKTAPKSAQEQRAEATRSRVSDEENLAHGEQHSLTDLRQLVETHQQEVSAKREELAAFAERLASAEAVGRAIGRRAPCSRCARTTSCAAQHTALAAERVQLESESDGAGAPRGIAARRKRAPRSAEGGARNGMGSKRAYAPCKWTIRCARRARSLATLREERGRIEVERRVTIASAITCAKPARRN